MQDQNGPGDKIVQWFLHVSAVHVGLDLSPSGVQCWPSTLLLRQPVVNLSAGAVDCHTS